MGIQTHAVLMKEKYINVIVENTWLREKKKDFAIQKTIK